MNLQGIPMLLRTPLTTPSSPVLRGATSSWQTDSSTRSTIPTERGCNRGGCLSDGSTDPCEPASQPHHYPEHGCLHRIWFSLNQQTHRAFWQWELPMFLTASHHFRCYFLPERDSGFLPQALMLKTWASGTSRV